MLPASARRAFPACSYATAFSSLQSWSVLTQIAVKNKKKKKKKKRINHLTKFGLPSHDDMEMKLGFVNRLVDESDDNKGLRFQLSR